MSLHRFQNGEDARARARAPRASPPHTRATVFPRVPEVIARAPERPPTAKHRRGRYYVCLLGPTRSRHFQHRVDELKDGAVLEAPRAVAAGARGVPPLTPPDVAAASREEEEQVGRQRRPGKRREGVRVDDGVVQRVPAQVSELLNKLPGWPDAANSRLGGASGRLRGRTAFAQL